MSERDIAAEIRKRSGDLTGMHPSDLNSLIEEAAMQAGALVLAKSKIRTMQRRIAELEDEIGLIGSDRNFDRGWAKGRERGLREERSRIDAELRPVVERIESYLHGEPTDEADLTEWLHDLTDRIARVLDAGP